MRCTLALLALLVAAPASAQTIVVDPGHGGTDPGAVGCEGLREAPTVLDVAQRVQSLLEAEGLRVELTRSDDRAVGLSARASFANSVNAELFVSVHSNANGGSPATGTETWIANGASSTSVAMAGHLQREMVAAWGLADRGVKRRDFTVVASTRMPAALTELGFTNRCDPDAALLRSPAARQDAAEAHARGVLLTLGRDPGGVGTGGTPTGTGVLRGVVFEDVGAGLEDTTRRLDGARVEIDGSVRPVDAETAHFRVDLAPGSYEVVARLDGFTTESRTCAVTAGGETWCSIGLRRGTEPDPTPTPVDAGAGPVLDAGGPTPIVPGPDPDPETPMDPADPGPDRPGGVAGCSASGSSAGGGWLALLLLLGAGAVLRRRRARIALAGLALLGLAGCGEPGRATAPLTETNALEPEPEVSLTARDATRVASIARLVDVRPIAEGLTQPVLAADGRRLAMSSPSREQLWLLEGEAPELVAEGPRVGYRPVFAGRTLRYRHPDQSPTAVPHYAIGLDGPALPSSEPAGWVRTDDAHQVVLTMRDRAPRVISPPGDRYLVPELAPDGRHVVFWGMTEGVFLHRVADGQLVRLGDGGHPRFDETGRYVVYDVTADEGHVLTEGELWICDTDGYRVAPITATPDTVEHMPTMAAGRVAFATPEGVLLGRLVFD